jgi:hypothetical protein
MDLSAELRAFLEEENAKEAVWGQSDCSATPCMWLRRLGHDVRLPAYSSKEGARAIVEAHGSLVAAWDHFLEVTAISERLGDPVLGDIAVVDTRLYGQIGGILAHGGILAIRRDEGGFAWFGPVPRFEKVWAVS